MSELQYLQSAPIAKNIRWVYLAYLQIKQHFRFAVFQKCLFPSSSYFPPPKETPTRKSRLSRTLSDVSSSESELSSQNSPRSLQRASISRHSSDSSVVSPVLSQDAGGSPLLRRPLANGTREVQEEEQEEESRYHSFHSNTDEQNHNSDDAEAEGDLGLNGGGAAGDAAAGDAAAGGTDLHQGEESHDQTAPEEASGDAPPSAAVSDDLEENKLVPMTLYLHRVKGLVLTLLVEPHFLSDTAAMEEVVSSAIRITL